MGYCFFKRIVTFITSSPSPNPSECHLQEQFSDIVRERERERERERMRKAFYLCLLIKLQSLARAQERYWSLTCSKMGFFIVKATTLNDIQETALLIPRTREFEKYLIFEMRNSIQAVDPSGITSNLVASAYS